MVGPPRPARRWGRPAYQRPTLEVARALLGQRLVRVHRGRRLAGLIAEVEAYIGEEDLACHARSGRTPRCEVMYGRPGRAYVCFTYGLHWMLNFVTEAEGRPAAVLIRALVPEQGVATMRRRRGTPDHLLTNGPAKLTQALGIDKRLNGCDLCAPAAALFVERRPKVSQAEILAGPRVGLNSTPEPWLSRPWNFRWRRELERPAAPATR